MKLSIAVCLSLPQPKLHANLQLQTILSLAALAVSNPLLNPRADLKNGRVEIYSIPGCNEASGFQGVFKSVDLNFGDCVDADTTNISLGYFTSFRGYPLNVPAAGVIAGVICEVRGYSEEKCGGTVITDNFIIDKCVNGLAMQSVSMTCCKKAPNGVGCENASAV
jgi:hypothetical protein